MKKIIFKYSIGIPLFWVVLFMRIVLFYRQLRYGYSFMRIPLIRGKFAMVDPEDYLKLRKYSWQLKRSKYTCYTWRGWSKKGINKTLYMHREIMNPPEGLVIDHINHNGLDNRKANLRFATYSQNNVNTRSVKRKGSSKYRGVAWSKDAKKWRAVLCHNGRAIQLGYFEDEKEAARAYDRASKIYRGEFAVLNDV